MLIDDMDTAGLGAQDEMVADARQRGPAGLDLEGRRIPDRDPKEHVVAREAPADDVRALSQLAGHLQAGSFITKFRKIFCRDEMNDDLVLAPSRQGEHEDTSEYQEILPTSPP